MKIFALIIAFLISSGILKSHHNVLSIETDIDPTPTIAPTNTPTPKLTVVVPTSMPKLAIQSSTDWQYPGSTKIADSRYQITEDPKKVTDWYVAKIKAEGANVTSFVKTTTNEKVLNSLAAAKNNWKIKIEISKETASAPVFILVTLDK